MGMSSHHNGAINSPLARWWSGIGLEWAARVTIILVYTGLAILNIASIQTGVTDWQDLGSTEKILSIAARVANTLFLALVAATTLTRLRPIAKAQGIQPRVSALLGTFLITTLAILPPAQLHPFWTTLSTLLVIAGTLMAFVVLRWLGRSFSIMAEARNLVTTGPYAIVRHPLYVAEELAALGILIQVFSPLAVLIIGAQFLLQLQRTRNEEEVLRATFPEYSDYAAKTPWIIPFWQKRSVH